VFLSSQPLKAAFTSSLDDSQSVVRAVLRSASHPTKRLLPDSVGSTLNNSAAFVDLVNINRHLITSHRPAYVSELAPPQVRIFKSAKSSS
jgi:hypothetical protein